MPRGYEVSRVLLKNSQKLEKATPRNTRIVVLDERGKDLATMRFAELLKQETTFVIGGADGLDETIKQRADVLLRLSSLTLPHALAQVILLEQLYRCAMLLTGHPYHRA